MSRLGPLRKREFRLLFAGRTISMAGSARTAFIACAVLTVVATVPVLLTREVRRLERAT